MATKAKDIGTLAERPETNTGAPGHVAVIGGGIAGMSAAHFLKESGAEVTLFESSDRFGGLGAYFEYGDGHLDKFYHVLQPTDDVLLPLLKAVGHPHEPYWRELSLGFYYDRELYPLGTPMDLLRFKPAKFVDRIRLGLTALYAAYVAKPEPLDNITVGEWLTKVSGKRAYERLWKPLLIAKFGDAYEQIPALWYWASFNREKGTKKEIKGYIRGGYKGMTDSIVKSLRERGVELHLNTPIEHLDLNDEGQPTLRANGEALTFDRVVLTVPFFFINKMTADGKLAEWLSRINHTIDYQGAVNVLLMTRRSLTRHYWLPVVNCGMPFDGIVETTRVIDKEDTGGHHLVYLLNYVHRSTPLFNRDPDEVRDEYVTALLDLIPELKSDDIVDAMTFKAPFVEPLYTPGYASKKPPFEWVPGKVYLATTTQVYPEVTSWNSSALMARRAVDALLQSVKKTA